jgi:hypothetical protein
LDIRRFSMLKRFIIGSALMATVTALPRLVRAQENARSETDLRVFVGSWKEDQSKSRPSISGSATYTFTAESDGSITIARGGLPFRDRVRMDGKDYSTPGIVGRTVSWTQASTTVFESTIKRDGTLLGTARWMLSEAGKHLTEETTPIRANGDNDVNIIEYVRSSGEGNTLLGVWTPISTRSAVADAFVVTLIGDELSVFYPKYGTTVYTMRLDGKRYSPTGPRALPDSTAAAESVGPRSLRRTTYQADKPMLETVMTVSPDGKTMTVTTHVPGTSEAPSLFIYQKQE